MGEVRKCETLSSDSLHPRKKLGVRACLSAQCWGARQRTHPGAKSVSSRVNERHYLKNEGGEPLVPTSILLPQRGGGGARRERSMFLR